MKLRNTLILLLLVLGLGGYIWFFERHQATSDELQEQSGRVVKLDQATVNAISIQNAEATIELRKREDGSWYLETLKDRADSSAVAQLLTSVDLLRSEATIPAGKDKETKEFGMADSHTRIRFTGSAQPVELVFGKDAAVEGKTYVHVEGANEIHAVSNDLRNQISKKPDEFRDKKLTDLTTQRVTKMQLRSAAGELSLAKEKGHWSITKPLTARGDDNRINDLIAKLTTAHVDQFITDTNLANYGLSEPKGTVTFSVEGQNEPVVLQIGGNPKEAKDATKTYVKLSTRDAVLVIPKEVETALASKPNDLRDHNLLRVESDIVDRLTVETGGQKFVLARKGESWVRRDGDKETAINVAAATTLLSTLQGAQVQDFVSDTAVDLVKYGLDQPQAKVTLSSYSSENTAETKAGEQPIVSILFGKAGEKPGSLYARLDQEPLIVSVPASLLEAVPQNAVALNELPIFSVKPEEVNKVQVSVQDQAALALEKAGEGPWKLTKGEGELNLPNARKLAETLAGLQAARWVGPVAPEHGFDKPLGTFSYTAGTGGKTSSHKLVLGSTTPEGFTYAMTEEKPGTFLITRAEVDTLTAPLLNQAAPAPAAAPGAPAAPVEGASPAPAPMPEPTPPPEAATSAPGAAPAPAEAPEG